MTVCLGFNEICFRMTIQTPHTKKWPVTPHAGESVWDHGVLFRTLIKEGHPFSLWVLWILALGQALTINEKGPINQGLMGPWGPAQAHLS